MPQASRAKSCSSASPAQWKWLVRSSSCPVRSARNGLEVRATMLSAFEVTHRIALGRPGGLAGRVPVEVVLHRHAEWIGGMQHPVQAHPGPFQLAAEAEDADAVTAQHRGAVHLADRQPEAVVDSERGGAGVHLVGVDQQPARQEARRPRGRRVRASLDLDQRAADGDRRGTDGLQQQRRERHARLDSSRTSGAPAPGRSRPARRAGRWRPCRIAPRSRGRCCRDGAAGGARRTARRRW